MGTHGVTQKGPARAIMKFLAIVEPGACMFILQMVELAHRGTGAPSMCKAPSTLCDGTGLPKREGSSTLEAAYLLRTQGPKGTWTQFKSQ